MENVLDKIALVALPISLWQGHKANKRETFEAQGIDGQKLPSDKLASLGSMRTIGKEATKGFEALKREALAACSRYGCKFGDGYAIPEDKLESVCNKLADIKTRFAIEKETFLSSYQSETEAWIMKNDPEWRDVIRRSLDSEDKVASVLGFNFCAYKVNPVGGIQNGLDEEVGGLHAQLCKEIRSMAAITLKTSFIGKLGVGKRALRPIQAILDKLEAMVFLGHEICDLTIEISNTLFDAKRSISYHKQNVLVGSDLNTVVGLLTKLSHLGLKTVYEEAAPLYEEEPEEEKDQDVSLELKPTMNNIGEWDF
jgi:hypothetical protein